MFTNKAKKFLAILMSVILVFSAIPFGMIASAATTVTVLDGQVSITDSVGTGKVSDGVVNITAKGSMLSKKTNNITVTNESKGTATLSFDYSASTYNSFTISATTVGGSGSYSKVLAAGETITIVLQSNSGFSNLKASLALSNFSLVPAAASSNVTFNYDSAYGSITVDGTAVVDGDVKEIPSTGAVLVAAAINDGKFYGWVNAADGSIISTDTSYTVTPAEDMMVKAVFIGTNSKPHFMLGTLESKTSKDGILGTTINYQIIKSRTHLFDNLNDAAIASEDSSTSKTIVLLNNGTLSAGTYTIPSGSTLLIPFDDANTLYKTEAQGRAHVSGEENTHSYSVYRELKLASGANIIINGAMSLSAKHRYAQGNKTGGGSPIDAISQVTMESGSSITVNNGGVLYAYGFITGSGAVTAKNGATVYENFQIMDFRGGTQSTNMKNGVFPMSQYYIQNIEVPLTLEYGAMEYGLTTIYMSSAAFCSSVNFIGPNNSMFNLTSGYVTKKYDGSTDRLIVELNGDLTVSPISIPVGTSKLDSEEYELPINGNISVVANSGSNVTMGQDIAMLPGSEIIIAEGATCTIGNGINVYIYDADNWGDYTGAGINAPFKPVTNAPGRTYTRTNADLVDATIQVDGFIDASKGFVYTTAGGANVFSEGKGEAIVTAGTQTVTHQFVHGVGYDEIPITPVKFKNADGTYLNSATDTYTYQTDGKWHCTNHNYASVEKEPTCTENGFITHTCSVCKDSYTENGKDALGHSYGDWIIEENATHSSEGSKYQECSVCKGKVYESIPVIICDYGNDGKVNGTELAMLRKFLLGTEKPDDATKKLFDMNDNGELSIVDLLKLKKYIAEIN